MKYSLMYWLARRHLLPYKWRHKLYRRALCEKERAFYDAYVSTHSRRERG